MLFNLVEKAIRYNQPGGSVRYDQPVKRPTACALQIPAAVFPMNTEPASLNRFSVWTNPEAADKAVQDWVWRWCGKLQHCGGTVQDEPAEGAGTISLRCAHVRRKSKVISRRTTTTGAGGIGKQKASRKREMNKFAKCFNDYRGAGCLLRCAAVDLI